MLSGKGADIDMSVGKIAKHGNQSKDQVLDLILVAGTFSHILGYL
jgi:hypothetical protein